MAIGRAFGALIFLSNFLLIHQHISNEKSNETPKSHGRLLLNFKVKDSLANINPDGNSLSWILTRDRLRRHHFGPCMNRFYLFNVRQKHGNALQVSLLLLPGDIAVNPGPHSTARNIQSQGDEDDRSDYGCRYQKA